MRSRAVRLVALVAALSALVLAVVFGGEEPRPYVITAIDYHFHDAHPTFPIGPGRDLVVKNAGRNLHNVSIPALGYSQDVEPGEQLVIPDIAYQLESAGRYTLVCVYHQDRGMNGTLVIATG